MWALIAILTLLLLALSIGGSAGMQEALATAIIFGLAIGAPLVLTVLLVLFSEKKRRRGKAS